RTNLIVTTDHGSSTVSGDLALFPLRALAKSDKSADNPPHHPATIGAPDPTGHPISGEVRLADILNNPGWGAYDGPATSSSMMTGILGTGPFDQAPRVYSSPEFTSILAPIPEHPAPGAVVVAKNGGAELLYLLGQDPALVAGLVKVLQSREEI